MSSDPGFQSPPTSPPRDVDSIDRSQLSARAPAASALTDTSNWLDPIRQDPSSQFRYTKASLIHSGASSTQSGASRGFRPTSGPLAQPVKKQQATGGTSLFAPSRGSISHHVNTVQSPFGNYDLSLNSKSRTKKVVQQSQQERVATVTQPPLRRPKPLGPIHGIVEDEDEMMEWMVQLDSNAQHQCTVIRSQRDQDGFHDNDSTSTGASTSHPEDHTYGSGTSAGSTEALSHETEMSQTHRATETSRRLPTTTHRSSPGTLPIQKRSRTSPAITDKRLQQVPTRFQQQRPLDLSASNIASRTMIRKSKTPDTPGLLSNPATTNASKSSLAVQVGDDAEEARLTYMMKLEKELRHATNRMSVIVPELEEHKRDNQSLRETIKKQGDSLSTLKEDLRRKVDAAIDNHLQESATRMQDVTRKLLEEHGTLATATALREEIREAIDHSQSEQLGGDERGNLTELSKTSAVLQDAKLQLERTGTKMTLLRQDLENKTEELNNERIHVSSLQKTVSTLEASKLGIDIARQAAIDEASNFCAKAADAQKLTQDALEAAISNEKALSTEIDHLREGNKKLEKQETELVIALASAQSSAHDLESKRAALQGQLAQMVQQEAHCKQELSRLRIESESTRKRLENELSLEQSANIAIRAEIETLKPLRASLDDASRDLAHVRQELANQQRQSADNEEHYRRSKLNEQAFLLEIQTRLSSVKEELEGSTTRERTLRQQLEEAQDHSAALKVRESVEMQQLKSKVAECDTSMSVAEVQKLKSENTRLIAETNSLEHKLSQAEATSRDLSQKVTALLEAQAGFTRDLTTSRNDLEAQQGCCKQLEQELERRDQREREKLQQQSKETFDNCKLQFDKDKADLANELKRTTNRLDEFRKRNDRLSAELAKLKKQATLAAQHASLPERAQPAAESVQVAVNPDKHGPQQHQTTRKDNDNEHVGVKTLSAIGNLEGSSDLYEYNIELQADTVPVDVVVETEVVRQQPEQDTDEDNVETPVEVAVKHHYPTRAKSAQGRPVDVNRTQVINSRTRGRESVEEDDPIMNDPPSSPKLMRPHKVSYNPRLQLRTR
ncbi:hypothetical protein OIO90_001175 [Microbotryomycetes sp. JL221]|nr:hypothetical protein OIO90_001175 [Microbotryomycetes sp. JL221]